MNYEHNYESIQALFVRFRDGLSEVARQAHDALLNRTRVRQGSNDECRDETRRLESAILNGLSADARQAREEILLSHQNLVRSVAASRLHDGHDSDFRNDLVSVGQFGLLSALLRYDPAVPGTFGAFARNYILGEVSRYLGQSEHFHPVAHSEVRDCRRVADVVSDYVALNGERPSVEYISEQSGLNANRVESVLAIQSRTRLHLHDEDGHDYLPFGNLEDESVPHPHSGCERDEQESLLAAARANLPDDVSEVLRLRHEVLVRDDEDGPERGLTFDEIGERFGISGPGAHRRVVRAERILREEFARQQAQRAAQRAA